VAAPEKFLSGHKDTNLPAYYGSIENMDAAIGRILEELDNQGLTEETLIVFMSDNGSYRGAHGSNGELTKGKTTLWEGGIRVPGIFSWPGVIAEGTIENRPAGVVDVFPTIKEIVGGEIDPEIVIDGSSLLPLFQEGKFERSKPLYWFYPPSRPVAAIRQGPWNLIADPEIDIPRGNMFQEAYIGMIKETKLVNFRLYNLRNDPKQIREVSSDNPEVFESMKKEMIRLHDEIVEEAIDWRSFSWDNN
jgi:arylsulfatase A